MSVQKIFITLIIIVACVVIGGLVLNVLLPNVTSAIVNAIEGQIHNATGMNFDFNGDGTAGDGGGQDYSNTGTMEDSTGNTGTGSGGTGVEGVQ